MIDALVPLSVIQANVFSPLELLVIGAIAVLLFGNKLPDAARSMGKALRAFKEESSKLRSEVSVEETKPSPAQATASAAPAGKQTPIDVTPETKSEKAN
jgi:TatA/E family protein of Tat protein translocase